MPIKVLVADDVDLIRDSIRRLLESDADVSVVAEVGALPKLEPAVKESAPDVLVLDLNLGPGVNVLIRKLKAENRKLRVVVITAFAQLSDGLMADALLDKINLGHQLLPLVKKLATT